MDFNTGDSSSSSYFYNDDDQELIDDLQAIDAEEDAAIKMYTNNNLLIAHYLSQ